LKRYGRWIEHGAAKCGNVQDSIEEYPAGDRVQKRSSAGGLKAEIRRSFVGQAGFCFFVRGRRRFFGFLFLAWLQMALSDA
jgi:hypothetical protein